MIQWHPIFAQLLRPAVEGYYELETTFPVGDAPREADYRKPDRAWAGNRSAAACTASRTGPAPAGACGDVVLVSGEPPGTAVCARGGALAGRVGTGRRGFVAQPGSRPSGILGE